MIHNGPVTAAKIELRELLARTLFSEAMRLRSWDGAKDWQKNISYKRADEALRRAGVENVTIRLKGK